MEINFGRKQPWSWYLTARRVCSYNLLPDRLSLSLSLCRAGCSLFPFLLPRWTSAEPQYRKPGRNSPWPGGVSASPPLSPVASDATSLEKARTTCSERRIRAKGLNGRIYFCVFAARAGNWQLALPRPTVSYRLDVLIGAIRGILLFLPFRFKAVGNAVETTRTWNERTVSLLRETVCSSSSHFQARFEWPNHGSWENNRAVFSLFLVFFLSFLRIRLENWIAFVTSCGVNFPTRYFLFNLASVRYKFQAVANISYMYAELACACIDKSNFRNVNELCQLDWEISFFSRNEKSFRR